MFSICEENSVAGKSTKADHKPINTHHMAALIMIQLAETQAVQHQAGAD